MQVKKLAWAGVSLQVDQTSILIDPIQHVSAPTSHVVGEPQEKLTDYSQLPRPAAILATHLHADHFDPESAIHAFGKDTPFYVPHAAVPKVEKTGLTQVFGMNVGDQVTLGALQVTAVQSIDGFGNPQVAWVVETHEMRVIHCGDTLWHGYWWDIAKRYGPFDLAFLPVSGAVLRIPTHTPQSFQPACLTPEQAVEAARLLQAKALVPIHYKTFHNPPYYIETNDVTNRLQKAARDGEVKLIMAEADEVIILS